MSIFTLSLHQTLLILDSIDKKNRKSNTKQLMSMDLKVKLKLSCHNNKYFVGNVFIPTYSSVTYEISIQIYNPNSTSLIIDIFFCLLSAFSCDWIKV